MQQLWLRSDSQSFPARFRDEDEARGQELWQAALARCDPALCAAARLDEPLVEGLLAGVFSTSPFLTGLTVRRAGTALCVLAEGPEAPLARAISDLKAACAAEVDEAALMRLMRVAKQDVGLIVALADLAGAWDLDRVTAALTDFADLAIRLSVAHLIAKYAKRGAWVAPDGPDGFGLVTLAMGKLGARELNYSSDVDLILLYDIDCIECDDVDNLPRVFNRFSKDLNKLLESRTADGYVFRTDLRLRPDPSATPAVVSIAAAETYYHSVGQTWERAAQIKARAVTGAPAAIAAVRAVIDPFVWRRHLDFWAIEDVHAVKKQIHAHKGGVRIAVAGHNIKLGQGGIREIEFFAQTQQLIWGGRDPAIRTRATVGAIEALVAAGHVERPAADAMIDAYRYLRRIEHRLQMVDDQQTHTIPADPEELRRVACLAGEPDVAVFSAALTGHLRRVHDTYAELFEETALPEVGGNLVFTGTDIDPGTVETLTGLGYGDPARATELVRGWFAGRYRATRSDRAQQLMNRMIPELLVAVGRTADPDSALLRFDRFLAGLPSGVQVFSLFAAHPELFAVIAEIMGSAPRLADYLAQHADLFDAMLGPDFYARLPSPDRLRELFAARLDAAGDYEGELDAARALTNEVKFQANLQLLRGTRPVEVVSGALSDLAETAVAALLPRVLAEFTTRYGEIPGGAFAVLALGRLGSREMTARSDLDLVFVYDVPQESAESTGPRAIPVTKYYAQLGQRLIAALSAPTGHGRLYEVDMRLRPSGNAGPVAVSLAGFGAYQQESAWTWEHMALTRARVVAATGDLGPRLDQAVAAALARPRDLGSLGAEVDAMRTRMRKEFGGDDPWDVKQRPGGLVDMEFITQYLQLAQAAERPACLDTSTVAALDKLAACGAVDSPAAETLKAAHHLWLAIQATLRLTVEGRFDPDAASMDQKAALARATNAEDFGALVARMEAVARDVQALYATIVRDRVDASQDVLEQAKRE